MEVSTNKELILTPQDVDKVLFFEMERKKRLIEKKSADIEKGQFASKDVELFPENASIEEKNKIIVSLIKEYLECLYQKKELHITLQDIYKGVYKEEVSIGITEPVNGYVWFKELRKNLNSVEKYLRTAVEKAAKGEAYTPSNAMVQTLLQTYESTRQSEITGRTRLKTTWQSAGKSYYEFKRNNEGVKETRFDDYNRILRVCFALMQKQYVEDVRAQDCRQLSDYIHKVPVRWTAELKAGETLESSLNQRGAKLSKERIKNFLISFRDFMKFCTGLQIIRNDFSSSIIIPRRLKRENRKSFSARELKLIFNSSTYSSGDTQKSQADFWVPLIGLFEGCRQNEICQLDVNDIIYVDYIPCISINDEGDVGEDGKKRKSVKNAISKRIIPIHSGLIQMGFLAYVKYQKQHHKKLFSELTFNKNNGYAGAFQKRFARYLKRVHIIDKKLTFHSLRHTFQTVGTNAGINIQYQNRLGGWSFNEGTGQRVYTDRIDMALLQQEINKVQYPCITRELEQLRKLYKETYVMKSSINR